MKLTVGLTLSILAVGCSQTVNENTNVANSAAVMNEDIHAQSLHDHVTRIGNKLFMSAKHIELKQGVAVGTFIPINKLDGKSLPSDDYLGHQIQESFVTVGTQAGLNVIEFKTTSAIKFQDNHDLMLSRTAKDVSKSIDAQYFLTGTYTEQEQSFIVNARIIDLKTKAVVAAATDYIPLDVLFKSQKTSMKHEMLYRKAY